MTEEMLGEKVKSLLEENSRLRREVQEAVRTREEFLSVAAHELRAPLTPLQLQIQMLLRAARQGPPEALAPDTLADKLLTCERHAKRLGKLIHDLLDVSRITSGRLNLDPEQVDLAALVREVVTRLQASPERVHSGSEVQLQIEGNCTGMWDRVRLDQIITNLIINAIQYGRGNPIVVRLCCCEDESGPRARLDVIDKGIGIEEESLSRIFERFERATALRNQGGGLGLGLYIVRQILEAMGGVVRVQSQLSVGSTFTVELPCQPAQQA